MPEAIPQETFEQFKKTFSYGSRNDLSFKFLANLSDEEATRFIQDLFRKLGESYDDGNFGRIWEHIVQGQAQGYSSKVEWTYNEGPFQPLRKPLSQSRLVLLTSSGHFVEGNDPEPLGVKNMTQEEAVQRVRDFLKEEPKLSAIPVETPRERLRVRHGGYDLRGALRDPNVVFPLERLLEMQKEGTVGELAPQAYSFVGACAQNRLLKQAGPQWVAMLKQQSVDAALLVPA
jgi:D-proline reductase (dithiol) PrdB